MVKYQGCMKEEDEVIGKPYLRNTIKIVDPTKLGTPSELELRRILSLIYIP